MDKTENPWTDHEKQILRDNWGKLSAREIGKLISRTKNAVTGQADRLNLKELQAPTKGPRAKNSYTEEGNYAGSDRRDYARSTPWFEPYVKFKARKRRERERAARRASMLISDQDVRERLKEAVAGEKHGQRGLAKRIGVSGAFLNQIISGKKQPSGKVLKYLHLEKVNAYRLDRSQTRTLQEQYAKSREEHRREHPPITAAQLQAMELEQAAKAEACTHSDQSSEK